MEKHNYCFTIADNWPKYKERPRKCYSSAGLDGALGILDVVCDCRIRYWKCHRRDTTMAKLCKAWG